MTVAELIEQLKELPQNLELVTVSDHTCKEVIGARISRMEWPGDQAIEPVVLLSRSNRDMGFISDRLWPNEER